jgi:hypothetical protein
MRAAFNSKEDYISRLWGRGEINDGQKLAADRIRAAFEAMGGSGAGGIDYEKTRVDGGSPSEPISDRSLRAADTMRQSVLCLGPVGHVLIINIAAQGMIPTKMSLSDYRRRAIKAEFMDGLEALAVQFGYQTRTSKAA